MTTTPESQPSPDSPPAPPAHPVLTGAAAGVLVAALAFGGGFAVGRSTAPDSDRMTPELPADWRELPDGGELPGGGRFPGGDGMPGGEGDTEGGLPDLERGGQGEGADGADQDADDDATDQSADADDDLDAGAAGAAAGAGFARSAEA